MPKRMQAWVECCPWLTRRREATSASTHPAITADGRYVLFESEAREMAPVVGEFSRALYRRDLATGETVCFSQDLTLKELFGLRTHDARMTADGRFVAFLACGASASRLFVRDMESGSTWAAGELRPPSPPSTTSLQYRAATVNLSGTRAAGVAVYLNGDPPEGTLWFDRSSQSCDWVLPPSGHFPTGVALERRVPMLSADGGHMVLCHPAETSDGIPLQVYFWTAAQLSGPALVSASGTGQPADSHALNPQLSPEGSHVVYLSRATNLLPDEVTPVWRAYLWDRSVGETKVVGRWEDDGFEPGIVMSADGGWVVAVGPGPGGTAVLWSTSVNSSQLASFPLGSPLAVSSSSRGWITVDTVRGVSFDGRYVAALTVATESSGEPIPAQVIRINTVTGEREHVSVGFDGLPAWGNTVPQISAEGGRIVYTSLAANLAASDLNGQRDLFCYDIATGVHRFVRHGGSDTAGIDQGIALSPDGRYVQFFRYGAVRELCIADLDSLSTAALPGMPVAPCRFSANGEWLAASLSFTSSTLGTALQVIHIPELLDSGGAGAVQWTMSASCQSVVLSDDGQRLAYAYNTGRPPTNLRVLEWSTDTTLLETSNSWLADLSFSLDGSRTVWAEASMTSPLVQVMQGETGTGSVATVSVAGDGTIPGDGNSRFPVVSPDGRYVAFASRAGNLAGDNPGKQIYLRDLQRDLAVLVSRGLSGGSAQGVSTRPFFSGDGHSLFFLSGAADLVSEDLNGGTDLFRVSILPTPDGLLAVLSRSVAGNGLTLSWNGVPGQIYRVESTADLVNGPWDRVAEISGEPSSLILEIQSAGGRYYRVVGP
jgi:Tol biopolymer transport system component